MDEETNLFLSEAREDLIAFATTTQSTYVPSWHHEYLADVLMQAARDVREGRDVRLMINMPPRHGKLLANDADILTFNGWKKHGDLTTNDIVFGREGQPVKILAIGEKQYANKKVIFTDGSSIKVHENHEWLVYDRNQQKERILETKQIASIGTSCKGIQEKKRGHRYRFMLDSNKLIEFPERNLPLHPYSLGAWLGDGKTSGSTICGHKDDSAIANKMVSLGEELGRVYTQENTGVVYYPFKNFTKKLRQIGLDKQKFIPEGYLFSSSTQRLELLAGLIDTDGSRDKRSRYRFINCNKTLIEQVKQLVMSLGGKAYITHQEAKLSSSGIQGQQIVYQVGFNLPLDIPVVLDRKRNQRLNYKADRRAIKEIIDIPNEPGNCIQVEGGIYLVGKTMIPTHNSELTSIKYIAWLLGNNPSLHVILASNTAKLAQKFSGAVRNLMQSTEYKAVFPDTELRTDAKSKALWELKKGGGMVAAGVEGMITGMGADFLIIDDPIKSFSEAQSQLKRDSQYEWYRGTATPRLQGRASAVIIIMTRWHMDDLSGRLLEQEKMDIEEGIHIPVKWKVIKFPAIAEEDEEYRKRGEPLWDLYPLATLNERRRVVGDFTWFAEYQQNPIATENAIFKRDQFKYYQPIDLRGKDLYYVTTVDPAISMKENADNSVVRTVAKDRNSSAWYLMEETWGKFKPSELIDAIFMHYEMYHSHVWIETVAYQKSLIYYAQEEMKRRKIFFVVNEFKSGNSKEMRIKGLEALYRNGMIFHRPIGDEALETELLQFPNGSHDDHADALAMAMFAVPPTRYVNPFMQAEREYKRPGNYPIMRKRH